MQLSIGDCVQWTKKAREERVSSIETFVVRHGEEPYEITDALLFPHTYGGAYCERQWITGISDRSACILSEFFEKVP